MAQAKERAEFAARESAEGESPRILREPCQSHSRTRRGSHTATCPPPRRRRRVHARFFALARVEGSRQRKDCLPGASRPPPSVRPRHCLPSSPPPHIHRYWASTHPPTHTRTRTPDPSITNNLVLTTRLSIAEEEQASPSPSKGAPHEGVQRLMDMGFSQAASAEVRIPARAVARACRCSGDRIGERI